jgi:hypothetical protein
MRLAVMSNHDVAGSAPLAHVDGVGDVWLWPEGVGQGTAITMTVHEWLMLRNSVESALGVAKLTQQQRDLVGYAACEGIEGDE